MATVGVKRLMLTVDNNTRCSVCNDGILSHAALPTDTGCQLNHATIVIIIIIINEKINVAFSPKTTRTRNIQKNEKNDVFGR